LYRYFQPWQTSITFKAFKLCAKVSNEVTCRFSVSALRVNVINVRGLKPSRWLT